MLASASECILWLCFWQSCLLVWSGLCPQLSQISLSLISTLQKSSLAYFQWNETTNGGNQSLILCVTVQGCLHALVYAHHMSVAVLKMCVVSPVLFFSDKLMSWCIGTKAWLLSVNSFFFLDACCPAIFFPHGSSVLLLWPWSSTSLKLSVWGSTVNQFEHMHSWAHHWSTVWQGEPEC